jgi:hypothetical protein
MFSFSLICVQRDERAFKFAADFSTVVQKSAARRRRARHDAIAKPRDDSRDAI